jgi:hypothetical protein
VIGAWLLGPRYHCWRPSCVNYAGDGGGTRLACDEVVRVGGGAPRCPACGGVVARAPRAWTALGEHLVLLVKAAAVVVLFMSVAKVWLR